MNQKKKSAVRMLEVRELKGTVKPTGALIQEGLTLFLSNILK